MNFSRILLGLDIPELDEDAFQPRGRNSGMRFYGGKGGSPAPTPDPNIGKAALANIELGKDWLSFAQEQFAEGNKRQADTDALNTRVINQQLDAQGKANTRSDQQWSDYNAIYRPMERMNALDALGGQDLSDDQVRKLIGSQNESQLAAMKSDHEARLAAIAAMSGGSTSRTSGAGMTQDQASSLADSILQAAQQPGDDQREPSVAQRAAMRIASAMMPGIDGKKAPSAEQKAELVKKLMGVGGGDSTTTTITMTPEERQALIDAETTRYQGQASGLGDITDQVMMQREASRNAQTNAAATARADVMGASAAQQQMQARNMASMGIDPTSGRFAGITRANDTNTALAAAGAQNNARTLIKNQGIALRADQANYGRGGSAVAAQQVGLGLNSGNSAVGNNASGNSNFFQNQGIMNQGFSGNIGANNSAGSMLNSLYGNQLNAWSAQQQANATSSAGIGSMIGTIGGSLLTGGAGSGAASLIAM